MKFALRINLFPPFALFFNAKYIHFLIEEDDNHHDFIDDVYNKFTNLLNSEPSFFNELGNVIIFAIRESTKEELSFMKNDNEKNLKVVKKILLNNGITTSRSDNAMDVFIKMNELAKIETQER